jgi:putative PIN family toxin of toxin-antitoxin system
VIAAVLDANVIVSGFPRRGGVPSQLIDRWLDKEFRLIVSEHILDGVTRAWNRPWFRDRFSRREVERALAVLRAEGTVVIPVPDVRGVTVDAEDDLVLATAIAGSADFLVTGDRRFRAIDKYESITIRTPREFLTILDRTPHSTS